VEFSGRLNAAFAMAILVTLNPGLPWQKLLLTRRRIFLPANWT
jgi:hypothetical protein